MAATRERRVVFARANDTAATNTLAPRVIDKPPLSEVPNDTRAMSIAEATTAMMVAAPHTRTADA